MKPHLHVAPARKSEPPTPEEDDAIRASNLARIGRFIGKLQDARFFGKVTVVMQNGKISGIHTEQAIKLEEL